MDSHLFRVLNFDYRVAKTNKQTRRHIVHKSKKNAPRARHLQTIERRRRTSSKQTFPSRMNAVEEE